MTALAECQDPYCVYIVPAFTENILASAHGVGVKACRVNNLTNRKIVEGEPLKFWSFLGVKGGRDEIKTDEQLIERSLETNTVFLLFRQPRGLGMSKPRTVGLAKVLGKRGHPYQAPFRDWPRKVAQNPNKPGKWMKQIPFPVEWYFTCDLDDKELDFERSHLPTYFTKQDPRTFPVVMEKLYAESRNHHSAWKRDGKMKIIPENMRSFEVEARKFHFATKDIWAGKEHLLRPKPVAEAVVVDE